ncbi:sensor histidine kinase [Streptomyces sp. NPDC050560]|uniref:sensor histidine kinase n=1 Tax=Streptomyces sp. NPDC050560 TaxID=3365630 RepID=UPI0037997F24
MRWALVRVCLAVTAMVVVAFAVPLGMVIEETARDRAVSEAERRAAAVAPALSLTTDRAQLARAVALAQDGGPGGRMALHLPPAPGRRDTAIGTGRAAPGRVAAVRAARRTALVGVAGGSALLQPSASASGAFAVVEVFVPSGDMDHGVVRGWLMLSGVAVALVLGSAAVADRLGARMVRPASRLVAAAHQLGQGRLGARVRVEGPAELRLAAVAFNSMADQVVRLLAAERERAADLSHRLRTPLTVLRLNAASLGEGPAAEQTRAAVEQLEREVDTIIRTAREAKPQTAAEGPDGGCDAAEVIRERMAFWSALAEDEGRRTLVTGAEGPPVRVPVARAELAAALDALLGNVFRHTPQGTAFTVDVVGGEDAVTVLVSDAGPGIADPRAALARGSGSNRNGSTGLGLDIARGLAEGAGGDVHIGTSPLGGTEIRIHIPLTPPTPPPPRRRRHLTTR